jgi:hypothetical protein
MSTVEYQLQQAAWIAVLAIQERSYARDRDLGAALDSLIADGPYAANR